MMRSLYSGISGLKTHQTRMDVIGNNIANVNTVAYKSSSATFSELMYQTSQRASGPNAETGVAGQNAKQIGLGVRSGAINTNIAAQGSTQSTGNPWDVRINGDAFFVVSQGNNAPSFFTRDGSFYVDGAGNLAMASTGYNVMGWQPDPAEPNTIKVERVSALRIMSAENMTYEPEATSKAYMTGIIDKNDDNVTKESGRSVNLTFTDSLGYSYTAKFSFHQVYDTSTPPVAVSGQFKLRLDDVIDSKNVSLKEVYGVNDLTELVSIGDQEEQVQIGTDTNGDPIMEDRSYVLVQYDVGKGTFVGLDDENATGNFADETSIFNLDFNQPSTAANLTNFSDIEVDMSTTSNWNNEGGSTISADAGASGAGEDKEGAGKGRKVGNLSGITIETDGKIWASYDNGQTRLLGQIAVATFPNPSGLEKAGDNLYSATMNSGEFDGVGVNITSDGSSNIQSGVLEMSNVDLSAEFTEMITTQRGFQANSRIITVSDTLLEELVNLKR